jgi:hypothetical protein
MITKCDDLRPKGAVEVECAVCHWHFWVYCLDPRLPEGPFVCSDCSGNETTEKEG